MTTSGDLYANCSKCGGNGILTPPMQERGSGWVFSHLEDCPDCNGHGAIPTAEGRQILKLVERFSRRTGKVENIK